MTMQGFNRFGAIAVALERGGGAVVRKAALDIEANAKSFSPVDTGNLKNSISASELNALMWIVGTVVEYGIHQEYGTVNQSGQAFMRPAVERVRPAYIDAWGQFLRSLR
jgi:HK97 gp10 family phage protein